MAYSNMALEGMSRFAPSYINTFSKQIPSLLVIANYEFSKLMDIFKAWDDPDVNEIFPYVCQLTASNMLYFIAYITLPHLCFSLCNL